MGSKICPICKRRNTTNGTPNYCMWGCGSLKNVPLEKGLDEIEEEKAPISAIGSTEKVIQTNLFG
ncbi:hypothetical protein IJX73_02760 [bacterium]|nr:hypothetical protein [bacterium]